MVKQPYRWDQLSETAKHREILNIFARASPRTRQFYERAHYRTPIRQDEWLEENWAIRWYIWHSFRYRDNRDNRGERQVAAKAAQAAPANRGECILALGVSSCSISRVCRVIDVDLVQEAQTMRTGMRRGANSCTSTGPNEALTEYASVGLTDCISGEHTFDTNWCT